MGKFMVRLLGKPDKMVGSYFSNTPSWAVTKSGTGTWGLGRGTCVWDVGRMGWDVGAWGCGDGDMGMRKRRLSFLRRMCKIPFLVLFFDSFIGKHKNMGWNIEIYNIM